jgi:hypothetical protein
MHWHANLPVRRTGIPLFLNADLTMSGKTARVFPGTSGSPREMRPMRS